jgi:hypothetical protein
VFPTHQKILFFLIVAASISFANFRLVAEHWFSLAGEGRSRTVHVYDSTGRLSLSRIFTPDTSEFAVGQVEYSYDGQGYLERTITISGLDTIGVIESSRDPDGRILSSKSFGRHGALSYLDSFAYSGAALVRVWRTDSQGRLSWVRIHDSVPGVMAVDTLFEPAAGIGLQPTMIEVDSLDALGQVVLETRFRRNVGEWLLDRLCVLSRDGERLVSVVTYESAVAPSKMLDSAVFSYDSNGNRIEEKWFDSVRSGTDLYRYSWENSTAGLQRFQVTLPLLAGARLDLPDDAVDVQLRGLDGRLLWRANVAGLRSLILPSRMGPHGLITISRRSKIPTGVRKSANFALSFGRNIP